MCTNGSSGGIEVPDAATSLDPPARLVHIFIIPARLWSWSEVGDEVTTCGIALRSCFRRLETSLMASRGVWHSVSTDLAWVAPVMRIICLLIVFFYRHGRASAGCTDSVGGGHSGSAFEMSNGA